MSMAAMMAMKANMERRKSGQSHLMGNDEMRGKTNPPSMGGEGWFVWDRMMQPWSTPPDRYEQPDEMRSNMQRMSYDGGNVTDMRTYRRKNEMWPGAHMERETAEERMEHQGRIGFGENGSHTERMTKEKAEKWIKSMKTPEGKPLQHIPYSEAQRLAPAYGFDGEEKALEFWVVINMAKSDNQDVGKKFANDAVDFYAALARDWLNDKDAVEDKLQMYKKYIVKPED